MNTYTFKYSGTQQQVKASKQDAGTVASALVKLVKINQYARELSGVIGQNEFEAEVMSLFGTSGAAIADQAAFQAERDALYASLPDVITTKEIPSIVAQANRIFNKHCPIRDERRTPEQEAGRVIASNQQYVEVQARQDAKAQAEAIESNRLVSQYPYLAPYEGSTKSNQAHAAANIKTQLAREFPGIKFSVKSEGFSGGDAIDIKWEDGPTTKQVRTITGQYENSTTDHTGDYRDPIDSVWCDTFGGSKYVMEQRSISKATEAALMPWANEHAEHRGAIDGANLIWRLMQEVSLPAGAVVTGIVWREEGEWAEDCSGEAYHWRVTFTA